MRLLVLATFPLILASCEPSPDRSEGVPPAEPTSGAASAAAPATATANQTAPVGIPEFGIPVALQGNWGMVPADCTSTRGDAKGLLRVSATTLTFYESVGRLGTIKDQGENSIRADYAFTGEGMEWMRDVTLTVSDDGNTLTRLDRGGEEPGGPFTYAKCAA